MPENLDGKRKKSLNRTLTLNFDKDIELGGFRNNEMLLSMSPKMLSILNDNTWFKSKYMNKIYNISSPKKSIIKNYYVSIWHALIKGVSFGEIDKIVVNYDPDRIDIISELIIEKASKILNIDIEKHEIIACKKDTIDYDKVRSAVKRGFYNEYQVDDSKAYFLYSLFYNTFYENEHDLSAMIIEYNSLDISYEYERWFLVKAILNVSIRENETEIIHKFLDILKEVKRNDFDYWNSKSYYILLTEGITRAVSYLEKRLNIDEFLNRQEIDYAESLVMKNFAQILPNNDVRKKEILNKCLLQTPQDVDLWKYYFNFIGDSEQTNMRYRDILENGYSDLSLFPHINLKENDQDLLLQLLILSNTAKNRKFAIKKIHYLKNRVMREIMLNFLNDTECSIDWSEEYDARNS